jgi:altronate dehydratase
VRARVRSRSSYLFQYGAIFKFNAVANTPLQAGQVTARGVVYLDSNLNPLVTRTFAITGGTGAYTTARGKITEQPIAPPVPVSAEKWLLDVP